MPDPKLSDEQIASRVRSHLARQPAARRRRISYSPEKTERWSTVRARRSITASGSDAYFYNFANSCDTRFIA